MKKSVSKLSIKTWAAALLASSFSLSAFAVVGGAHTGEVPQRDDSNYQEQVLHCVRKGDNYPVNIYGPNTMYAHIAGMEEDHAYAFEGSAETGILPADGDSAKAKRLFPSISYKMTQNQKVLTLKTSESFPKKDSLSDAPRHELDVTIDRATKKGTGKLKVSYFGNVVDSDVECTAVVPKL